MASVQQWLAELGCEQYTGIFEGSGYTSVSSLRQVATGLAWVCVVFVLMLTDKVFFI